MKTKRIILISISVLAVVVIVYAWMSGAFTGVKVMERVEGGYKLAGMEYTGSYKKSGKYMSDVEAKLKDMGIQCSRGFGIYYDKPGSVPEDKCRSFMGFILEASDFDKVPSLEENGFKIDTVVRVASAVAEFPARTGLSYMIGPMKVYPAMTKYFEKTGYTPLLSLEIYDMQERKITYIMQYANHP